MSARFSRFLVRLRVPVSWLLGLLALALARPSLASLASGLALAAWGEALRVWASGHLVKGEGLTRSGPYSRTRNPLYLGSMLMGLGFAVAAARWELIALWGLLVAGVFLPVIRTEAKELARRFPRLYREYAETVPLLLPTLRWRARWVDDGRFDWKRVWANREHVTLIGFVAVACVLGLKLVPAL